MRPRIALLAATALALLAAAASGCGGSDSDGDGVAALDTGANAAAATSTTEQETEQDPQEAALKWARCMRDHGVDVPDPQVGSGGRVTIRPGRGEFRRGAGDDEEFRAAQEACGTPLGNARPQLSDEEREQLQETMLAFARCMREQGIDMPDPDFSGGGGLFRVGPRGGLNRDDADFRAAQEKCQPILQELEGRLGLGRRP